MVEESESVGSLNSSFGKLWQSIKETFSMSVVTDQDGNHFIWSSLACGMATVVQMLILYGVVAATGNPDLEQAGRMLLKDHRGASAVLILVFLGLVFAAPILQYHGKLKYFWGNLCLIAAFGIPVFTIAYLVKNSGGLSHSICNASFISLFGLSLLVPKDISTKLILFCATLAISIWLVIHSDPLNRDRDWVCLALSLFAYLAGGLIRFLVNVLRFTRSNI